LDPANRNRAAVFGRYNIGNTHQAASLPSTFLKMRDWISRLLNWNACDLFGDDAALMATGFEAWAGVFFLAGHWFGMGGGKKLPARLLAMGERTVCLAAADDWFRIITEQITPTKRGAFKQINLRHHKVS
jgi:hypothetical protein